MSSKTLEILFVNPPKTGVGKTGNAWSMTECECIIRDAENRPSVGVLLLSRTMDASKVVPGLYNAVFDLEVGYKDRKVGAVVTELVPLAAVKPAPVRAAA